MSEDKELVADMRGRLMVNELFTFAVLAVLTKQSASRAEIIHEVIGAVESMMANIPEPTPEDRRRKQWAAAWWTNLRTMLGDLSMLDAGRRQ